MTASKAAGVLLCGVLVGTVSGCAKLDGSARASSAPEAARTPSSEVVPLAGEVTEVTPAQPSSGFGLFGSWNALRGDPYALDDIDRHIESPRDKLVCDRGELVSYTGRTLRYRGALQVREAFIERLARFEDVVAESAREIYGRPPRTVLHLGAFSCRSSRGRSYRMSEHALGNALDVSGFEFAPVSKGEPVREDVPKALRRGFQVVVSRHWNERPSESARLHTRFLHLLVDRLVERGDIFRGFVGPPYPGHHDHLHLDMSPWRYVRGMTTAADDV